MANILQLIIGKQFGKPEWLTKVTSPFSPTVFVWEMTGCAIPHPIKNFDHKEVEAFRNYLTEVINEYHRIVAEMELLNEPLHPENK